MTDIMIEKDDPIFHFVEQLVKSAIKKNIELDSEWEIAKVLFEDSWEAQRLNPSVEDAYGLQISDIEVDVDFAEDDDVESLTNCYVTFDATGKLAAALRDHGLRPQIEIDVFNNVIGSSIALLSDEDVDNEVGLLHVWVQQPKLINGLLERLKRDFGEEH